MVCRIWDVAVAISFSFMVAAVLSDELPQPENLNLSVILDCFSVTAKWKEPPGLDEDCKVNYTVEMYKEKCPPHSTKSHEKLQLDGLNYTWTLSNVREICVIVKTNPVDCGNKTQSKPVYRYYPAVPALVKNFSCVYYSNMKMNCSWSLKSSTSDLQLFYKNTETDNLKHCSSYITDGPMKIGCHLNEIDISNTEMYFMINGSGSTIPNSFIIEPHNSVKPETPKLTIRREGKKLIFNSTTPNFSPSICWKYMFKYSKCNEMEEPEPVNEPQLSVEYDTACKYTVQTQTLFTYCGKDSKSEMSEPDYYGEDNNPNLPFMVAMIVTPIIMSCCLITALVLIRRYKNIILPQIPEPSLLLFKDMLNNNNDGRLPKTLGGGNLYVPITEDVERDVRLEPTSTSLRPKQ